MNLIIIISEAKLTIFGFPETFQGNIRTMFPRFESSEIFVRLSAFSGNSICHLEFQEIQTRSFGQMESAPSYVLIFVLRLIGRERGVQCLLPLVRPGAGAIWTNDWTLENKQRNED